MTNLLGTNRIRTTSFHSQANGLVERFHRVLKSSLKAHENHKWTETLPAVLLGIRVAVKPDIQASSAKLVYGTTLQLPAELCSSSKHPQFSASDFIQTLRDRMNNISPCSTVSHVQPNVFMHPELKTWSHVFLRIGKLLPSLSQPYSGPHKVLSRGDKTITIEVNGRKSCFIRQSQASLPPYRFTSSRTVRYWGIWKISYLERRWHGAAAILFKTVK